MHQDQETQFQSLHRRPMVVFYRLLDIAGINSFKHNGRKCLNMFTLAMDFMRENLKYRATITSLSKELVVLLGEYRETANETWNIKRTLHDQ